MQFGCSHGRRNPAIPRRRPAPLLGLRRPLAALVASSTASMPRVPPRQLVWLSAALITLVPAAFGYWFHVRDQLGPGWKPRLPAAAVPYLATCWAAATTRLVDGCGGESCTGPRALRSDRRRVVRLLRGPEKSGGRPFHLVRLPGNQMLSSTWPNGLDLESLPRRSTGSRSSTCGPTFHRPRRPAYSRGAQIYRTLRPDLVAITGDRRQPRCIAWIPQTLGRLESRYRVFMSLAIMIFESHDPPASHWAAGLTYLGSRWIQLAVGGSRSLLAATIAWIAAADLGSARASAGGPADRLGPAPTNPGRGGTGRRAMGIAWRSDSPAFSAPSSLSLRRAYASGVSRSADRDARRAAVGQIPLSLPRITRLVLHAARHAAAGRVSNRSGLFPK